MLLTQNIDSPTNPVRFSIKLASAQGKYKGRVNKLNQVQADALRQAWNKVEYPSKIALGKAFGISRQAVYRYLRNNN